MSLRLEMLQVARLARTLLGDSAELVASFVRSQQNGDGGYKDRDGKSDLYYTAFGIEALRALQWPSNVELTADYLTGFGAGGNLDFVHACCLARCWAGLGSHDPGPLLLHRIESFRTADGGYNPVTPTGQGTAYGCFLALGAYQDCGQVASEPLRLVQSLKLLETPDGAWSNELGMKIGSTNATAAAVAVLRNLSQPINPAVGNWLLERAHPQGGFVAAPGAPLPDLLSTATALHALAGLQVSFQPHKETCLDFVDSLWTNKGGFHGHWADDDLDCEYTYYGLLALGHLSL